MTNKIICTLVLVTLIFNNAQAGMREKAAKWVVKHAEKEINKIVDKTKQEITANLHKAEEKFNQQLTEVKNITNKKIDTLLEENKALSDNINSLQEQNKALNTQIIMLQKKEKLLSESAVQYEHLNSLQQYTINILSLIGFILLILKMRKPIIRILSFVSLKTFKPKHRQGL